MKKVPYTKTAFRVNESSQGEPLERKIERFINNGEEVDAKAPIIHTERKDGVISAYNIRTDKWELAIDATNAVMRKIAKRDEKPEAKVIKMDGENEGKTQPSDGTSKE